MVAACSNSNSAANKDFELKGKLSNSSGEIVFLEQMLPNGMVKIDSATLSTNGDFEIITKLPEVGFYRLRISEKNFATLVLSPNEKVTLNGNAQDLGNSYQIEGSKDSKLFWDLNAASSKNYRQRDSIQKYFESFASSTQDKSRLDSLGIVLEKPYTALVDAHYLYLKKFVETNLSSMTS